MKKIFLIVLIALAPLQLNAAWYESKYVVASLGLGLFVSLVSNFLLVQNNKELSGEKKCYKAELQKLFPAEGQLNGCRYSPVNDELICITDNRETSLSDMVNRRMSEIKNDKKFKDLMFKEAGSEICVL